MAFYSSVNKTISLHSLKFLVHKVILQPTVYFCKYQPISEEKDVLDDFTSQLMEHKSSKWENRKIIAQKRAKEKQFGSKVLSATRELNVENDIRCLSVDEVNLLFKRAIDFDDRLTVLELAKECVKYEKIPSLIILLQVLPVCSQSGDKDTIVDLVQLCEKLRPEILQENSHFEHYLAEAIWVKGNIIKSLQIFEKVYRENIYLRRRIRCILKYLILDSVTNHSEATLVNIIRFSNRLFEEYKDPFALAHIWELCFLSQWFSDQQLALELLEQNDGLCNAVVGRIPYVVKISLKHHRTEVIYRLTEMLLKFKLESELAHVLLTLVDYWIKRGDLRRCNEVIKWSIKNNIDVPTLTNNTKIMELFKSSSENEQKSEPSSQKRPQTEYKF